MKALQIINTITSILGLVITILILSTQYEINIEIERVSKNQDTTNQEVIARFARLDSLFSPFEFEDTGMFTNLPSDTSSRAPASIIIEE